MVQISKKQISNWLLLETMADRHALDARIDGFKNKYDIEFSAFEKKVKSEAENFEWWDDYMAWKACLKQSQELQRRVEDNKNERLEIA